MQENGDATNRENNTARTLLSACQSPNTTVTPTLLTKRLVYKIVGTQCNIFKEHVTDQTQCNAMCTCRKLCQIFMTNYIAVSNAAAQRETIRDITYTKLKRKHNTVHGYHTLLPHAAQQNRTSAHHTFISTTQHNTTQHSKTKQNKTHCSQHNTLHTTHHTTTRHSTSKHNRSLATQHIAHGSHDTTQHATAQRNRPLVTHRAWQNTTQHNTTQHNKSRHNTTQQIAAQHNMTLHARHPTTRRNTMR